MEDNVVEGAFILANTTIPADNGRDIIEECARGVIISCLDDSACKIAFLNKDCERIIIASLQLPDHRVLHPIEESDGYSESDSDLVP